MVLPAVLRELAAEAIKVPGEAATKRFATAAGEALARLADGMSAEGRAHQVLAAVHKQASSERARSVNLIPTSNGARARGLLPMEVTK